MEVHERAPGDRARLTQLIAKEKNVKQRDRLRSAALGGPCGKTGVPCAFG